jgi:uncharacterized membrane protein
MSKHPALVAHNDAMSLQDKVATKITEFAGSMAFVWLHVTLFAAWIVANITVWKFDAYPFQLLTLVVSLEAIFLSTFVMIGQNHQGQLAEAKADHDYENQVLELRRNTELTEAVHKLVKEIHG